MLADTRTIRTVTHKKRSASDAWRLQRFFWTEANPTLSRGVDHCILYMRNVRGIRR